MFIKTSQSGYNRNGEQFARGSFLLVFSHNEYKWEEQNNTPHVETKGQTFYGVNGEALTCQCTAAGDAIAPYTLKYCPVHGAEYKTMPRELNRKLYACVRHVSLRQLGHWMMGRARIAGQSVTVSGAYGGDGLPCDYEKLSVEARAKLVEVPAELAELFWNHNSAGSEADAMKQWAIETFKGEK